MYGMVSGRIVASQSGGHYVRVVTCLMKVFQRLLILWSSLVMSAALYPTGICGLIMPTGSVISHQSTPFHFKDVIQMDLSLYVCTCVYVRI